MSRLAAVLALLLVVLVPVASAATPQFSEEQLETEVMCPVCGTRLDLSHSPAADQIRAFIEQKHDAGWTKQQVKDALVAQFGERILATTPTSGSGLLAWLVPVIAGVAGVAIAVGLVVAWRRRPPRSAPAAAAAPLDDEARRRVDEALRDFERRRGRRRVGAPERRSSIRRGGADGGSGPPLAYPRYVALELLVGPANAGKVAELYRRHRASLEAGTPALLVVPTLPALWRAERELLDRGALLGGLVVTFDGVVERVVRLAGADRAALPSARRRLELARLAAGTQLDTIAVSAAGARFPDALGRLFDRLGSALVDPAAFASAAAGDAAGTDLGRLYAAWWARLDELAAWDAPRRRIEACRLLAREVTAWDGAVLHVQGFEDLTHAQETLVRLVADRAGAVVTLPYEPGRPAFAALSGSAGRLAEGAAITELPPLTGLGHRASSSSSGACSSRARRPPPSRVTRACGSSRWAAPAPRPTWWWPRWRPRCAPAHPPSGSRSSRRAIP